MFGLSDLSSEYAVSQSVYYDRSANSHGSDLATMITEVTTVSSCHTAASPGIIIVRCINNVKRNISGRVPCNFKDAYEVNRANKKFNSRMSIDGFKRGESLEFKENLEKIETTLIGERYTYRWPKTIPCGDITVSGPKTEFQIFDLLGHLTKNFPTKELREVFWELHGIRGDDFDNILRDYYLALDSMLVPARAKAPIEAKQPSKPEPKYTSWGSW